MGEIKAEVPSSSSGSNEEIQAIRLERLKHVLGQQRFFNESTHKYLVIFQTTVTAIVVAGVIVFMSWKSLVITFDVAKAALRALELLLLAVGAFMILVIITNIASWWDSRTEETKLMNDIGGVGFRAPPSAAGAWRWFETWFLVLVVIIVGGSIFYFELAVLPLMN